MSRLPRELEHLKTGFAAEAASAARFRANAERAERDGQPNLAVKWRDLAAAKDRLAAAQLEAADQVLSGTTAVKDALSEERYENDVLYAKMLREVDGEVAAVLNGVVAAQREHIAALEELRRALQSSSGDI